MRYRLRTLLIATAIGPPILAGTWIARAGLLEAGSALFHASGVILGLMAIIWGLGVLAAITMLVFFH